MTGLLTNSYSQRNPPSLGEAMSGLLGNWGGNIEQGLLSALPVLAENDPYKIGQQLLREGAGVGGISDVGGLVKAKAMGFDPSAVFRHDRSYRYPNPDEGSIKEILTGSDNTAFDGIFAENIGGYHSGMELLDNDFIVKNHATHSKFNTAVDGNPLTMRNVLDDELGISALSPGQKSELEDLIREDEDDVISLWQTEYEGVPVWVNELFGTDDLGEISWELQRLRGRVAKALGFDAVDMSDELGISTLLLDGSGVRNVSANFNPKHAESKGLLE